MGQPLAVLPMYDWDAMRDATGDWWSCLRDAVREAGFEAPKALDRSLRSLDAWRSPNLLFGQTCALPYVTHLQAHCDIIGIPVFAPANGQPTLPAGSYNSLVVIRKNDPRDRLADFREAVAAVNGVDSLSGSMALLELVATEMGNARFFQSITATGSHAASIAQVADGRADIAAIDCTTWALAQRHLPAARMLRVLTHTALAPALPYITAKGRNVEMLADAVERALAGVGPETKAALGLVGFERRTKSDYLGIEARHRATRAIAEAHGLVA